MDDLQYFNKESINFFNKLGVLNLVINGWPSILAKWMKERDGLCGFKPCYKWMTFNTLVNGNLCELAYLVLNLVINGWPSILKYIVDNYGIFEF